jgi:hypothetical protein
MLPSSENGDAIEGIVLLTRNTLLRGTESITKRTINPASELHFRLYDRLLPDKLVMKEFPVR